MVCAAFCHLALVFAVMHLCHMFLSISDIDKLIEWSMIPACPGLVCFFNRGNNTEGTNSSEVFCFMFVYVFCKFVSGLILWFGDNLWFDDLLAE